jgi:predicted TPR repeat methyltransferase
MVGKHLQDVLGESVSDQTEETPREMTVDEAIELAIQLQRQGDLEPAEMIHGEIRRVDPDNARATHYRGVLLHQLGRHDEGIAQMEHSLAREPDRADWHNNLAIALQSCSRFEDAIREYERAIALDPNHANAYSNLGVLLRATGRPAEAEAAYHNAIRINPTHIDAYTNLGILLNGLKRTQESVACFCKVITLRPKHPEARKLLALAHCTLGEFDEATRIFEDWLASEPDDPVARHMLSACTGRDVPRRASDGFVATTFDSFAASFESKLAKLSYRAPKLVAAMLEDAAGEPAKAFDVLDAGCGTGLCGALISGYARTLTGVDLSAGMMAQAREKKVYDELLQMELTECLRARPAAFDVIVSADTLVYFGDLDAVVSAAGDALRSEGLLIFTLERAMAESAPDFRLETHGRYTHAQGYVERVLEAHGFEAIIGHSDLRTEAGAPVAGLVIRARKAGAQSHA